MRFNNKHFGSIVFQNINTSVLTFFYKFIVRFIKILFSEVVWLSPITVAVWFSTQPKLSRLQNLLFLRLD